MINNRIKIFGINWIRAMAMPSIKKIGYILAIVLLVITFMNDDLREFIPKEEVYTALEGVVYEIAESENITYPITRYLQTYNVTVNNDGTYDITLYGNVERLKVKFSHDFQIKSMERDDVGFDRFVIIYGLNAITCIAFGRMICATCYVAFKQLNKKNG